MARVAGRRRLDALVPARARGAVPAARAARCTHVRTGSSRLCCSGRPTGSSSAPPTASGPRPRCSRSARRSCSRRCARATAVAWPFAAHARTYAQAGCGAVLAALTLATLALNVASSGEPRRCRTAAPESARARERARAARVAEVARRARRQNPELAVAAQRRPRSRRRGVVPRDDDGRALRAPLGAACPTTSTASRRRRRSRRALSIVWGIAGLAAMIVGARSRRRGVWLVGAALMSVVVAKLFLVDLGNTATLARVVSFLGVGVLLLVVGYFAPVPPRADAPKLARPARCEERVMSKRSALLRASVAARGSCAGGDGRGARSAASSSPVGRSKRRPAPKSSTCR